MSVRGEERECVGERGRGRERECVRGRQKDFRMCLTVGSSVQMKDVFRLITQLTEKVFFFFKNLRIEMK